MHVHQQRRSGEDRRVFTAFYPRESERRRNTADRRRVADEEMRPAPTGKISPGAQGAHCAPNKTAEALPTGAALREHAEARLRDEAALTPENLAALSPAATAQLLHELRVHQIELEMQNDELRRIQVELDDSRARYFDLYDLAPAGYCTVSEQGLILQANLYASRALGFERSALIGQAWARFCSKEDQHTCYLLSKRCQADGATQTGELRMTRRDGETFWAQLTINNAQQSDTSAALRIMFSDIGERKRAEEAVRKQEEFFQLIAENIADFIAVLDLDGRRIYSSPSYTRFFGTDRELHASDPFAEIHPDDRTRVQQVFRETVRTGIGRQFHYRILMADGTVRAIESSGNVIRGGEGQIAQVVVVSRDVTERRSLEARLQRLASLDDLTQLPNRRLLGDRLQQTMAASARSASHAALMFIDLDHFKLLNDTHGHRFGDLLLIEVANRLKSCVREIDTVARCGGDEYVVVISELDAAYPESRARAEAVAEKIRTALARPFLLRADQQSAASIALEYQLTASIGIVLFAAHRNSQDDILKWADAAMYEAKAAGRNGIRFHQPSRSCAR